MFNETRLKKFFFVSWKRDVLWRDIGEANNIHPCSMRAQKKQREKGVGNAKYKEGKRYKEENEHRKRGCQRLNNLSTYSRSAPPCTLKLRVADFFDNWSTPKKVIVKTISEKYGNKRNDSFFKETGRLICGNLKKKLT